MANKGKDRLIKIHPEKWMALHRRGWTEKHKSVWVDCIAYETVIGRLPGKPEHIADQVRVPVDEFMKLWEKIGEEFYLTGNGYYISRGKPKNQTRVVQSILTNVSKNMKADGVWPETLVDKVRKRLKPGMFMEWVDEPETLRARIEGKFTELLKDEELEYMKQYNEVGLAMLAEQKKTDKKKTTKAEKMHLYAQELYKEHGLEPDMIKIIDKWLQYKAEKQQAYTPIGLRGLFTKLLEMSEYNPRIATKIVDQSIANNWAGLFPLKKYQTGFDKPEPRGLKREQVKEQPDMPVELQKKFNEIFRGKE